RLHATARRGQLGHSRLPEPHAGRGRARHWLHPHHAASRGYGALPVTVRHPEGDGLPLLHPARLPGGAVRAAEAPTDVGHDLSGPMGRQGAVGLTGPPAPAHATRYATTSSCGVGTLLRLSAALAQSPVAAHDDKLIDCVEPDAGGVNRRDGGSAVFVKTLKDLKAAGREKVVAGGSARTVRFLTKDDGL